MIEIKNVTKQYKNNQNAVVKNLDLTVRDGEIFAFLGPNGAGKTTTIKMITGILGIDKGDILIDGNSMKDNCIKAKQNIGFVPDNPNIFLKLKGIEYLNFIADIYNVPINIRNKKIEEYSTGLGIYDILNNKIETYSHGTRQKIIIIGVLIHNPKNWILDEPLSGLDPKAAFYLKERMKEHAKNGNTVFFSTHILEIAEKLCDTIGIIDKGELVLAGKYNEIKEKFKNDKSLEEIFIDITKR